MYIYFIEFLLQNYDIVIIILIYKGIYIFLDFLYLRILKLKFKYNNVNKLALWVECMGGNNNKK